GRQRGRGPVQDEPGRAGVGRLLALLDQLLRQGELRLRGRLGELVLEEIANQFARLLDVLGWRDRDAVVGTQNTDSEQTPEYEGGPSSGTWQSLAVFFGSSAACGRGGLV